MAFDTAGEVIGVFLVLFVFFALVVFGFLEVVDSTYWLSWRVCCRNCRKQTNTFANRLNQNVQKTSCGSGDKERRVRY